MVAIKKVSIHKTALTISLVTAVSSLIFLLPMMLLFGAVSTLSDGSNSFNGSTQMGMMIFMPIMYLVLGYIMTALGAVIYNLIARFTGGIQIELTDSEQR